MILTSITGVPGTGKTTLSERLRQNGLKIEDGTKLAEDLGCKSGECVNIDCMLERLHNKHIEIVEGHFSHLLRPFSSIILYCTEDELVRRLNSRKYPSEKIRENVDAMIGGIMEYECRDIIPSSRILIIDTTNGVDVDLAMDFISRMRRKMNGS
ncbi:AAA family ATPase [Caldiplasma sukawensis]